MKVFVSWSGAASRAAAELVKEWLPCVIQEADVWVSSQDIAKGERWSSSIQGSLADHLYGLTMLTRENILAPWIMFEAGALSKTLDARFAAILCNITHTDLIGTPLSQFQNAIVSKDDIFQVLISLNSCSQNPLEATRLAHTFSVWWPQFDEKFRAIDFASEKKPVMPSKDDSLAVSDRLTKIEGALEGLVSLISRNQPRHTSGVVHLGSHSTGAVYVRDRANIEAPFRGNMSSGSKEV